MGFSVDSLVLYSALAGVFAAVIVVMAVSLLAQKPVAPKTTDQVQSGVVEMLFQHGRLSDADDVIWGLLGEDPKDGLGWAVVRRALLPLFPQLPEKLSPTSAPFFDNTGADVQIIDTGDALRVSLSPANLARHDWLKLRACNATAKQFDPILKYSPHPAWLLQPDGEIGWGNAAFHKLSKRLGDKSTFSNQVSDALTHSEANAAQRISIGDERGSKKRWYEVTTQQTEEGVLHFATGIDAVVQAEEAQRNFVQTLSKTFANLTTGLAIFDRDRRLVLFNPALIDLSGVPVEFLSGRPNLFEFFDKLREKRVMPEPKNYHNWRERMGKLVAAASDDRFREAWNLPDGQTYDVIGRPYPDGAVAFLFNDITAEISLTRSFRTEIETMQSVIDSMDDAVVVFTRQGVLSLCNTAYKDMWNVDPDSSIHEATIESSTEEWKAAFHPDPIWPELREFVTNTTDRASWDSELRSKDGREFVCRVDPISFGATLIRFGVTAAKPPKFNAADGLQIVSA